MLARWISYRGYTCEKRNVAIYNTSAKVGNEAEESWRMAQNVSRSSILPLSKMCWIRAIAVQLSAKTLNVQSFNESVVVQISNSVSHLVGNLLKLWLGRYAYPIRNSPLPPLPIHGQTVL